MPRSSIPELEKDWSHNLVVSFECEYVVFKSKFQQNGNHPNPISRRASSFSTGISPVEQKKKSLPLETSRILESTLLICVAIAGAGLTITTSDLQFWLSSPAKGIMGNSIQYGLHRRQHIVNIVMKQIIQLRRIKNTSQPPPQDLLPPVQPRTSPAKRASVSRIKATFKCSGCSKNPHYATSECNAAGFMAGSIPTKGTSNFL